MMLDFFIELASRYRQDRIFDDDPPPQSAVEPLWQGALRFGGWKRVRRIDEAPAYAGFFKTAATAASVARVQHNRHADHDVAVRGHARSTPA